MSNQYFRPLPSTLEEITAEWLTAALRSQAPDVTVRGFEIVDEIRGTSTKLRVRLDLDEAGKRAGIPETVIIKGGFESHSPGMYYMYEREIIGYRDIWPKLGLHSPASYFADYDPEQRHGIVIMEDLVPRGVSFCSALVPQSHEQVERRLTALAAFHAGSWGSAKFEAGGEWQWAEEPVNNMLTFVEENLQADAWKTYLERPRGGAVSTRFHDRDWAIDALLRVKALSASLPPSLVHGDTHLGNLYIEADGTPGFYDGIVARAPAMWEVTYHIVCALDLADRPRWECSLVQHYIEELRRNGIAAPSFDEAMYQYRIYLAWGYFVFLINAPVFQSETINTAYAARFNAAMLDHGTFDLLKTVALPA